MKEYQAIGNPTSGSIRFNTDSNKLEIYNGNQWWEIDSTSPEVQTGGTRGVLGGDSPSPRTRIDFFNMSTTGGSEDFGDLTQGRSTMSGSSSRTRGIFLGGQTPGSTNVIDFITISSKGDAQDFGDHIYNGAFSATWSNGTRLVKAGGEAPSPAYTHLDIEYVTIASASDGIDFGNLTEKRRRAMSIGSPTRMLVCGGYSSPASKSVIDFITMSTQGNGADFGDLSSARHTGGGSSNAVTGFVSSDSDVDRITIATLGSALDNGADLTSTRTSFGSTSSKTRAVFCGGYSPASPYPGSNVMDYQQFASDGNFIDFGDLASNMQNNAGISNGHGGLG